MLGTLESQGSRLRLQGPKGKFLGKLESGTVRAPEREKDWEAGPSLSPRLSSNSLVPAVSRPFKR